MYVELNAALQPLQQQISQISLSPRFAWQVKLDNGMVLELGREEMQAEVIAFCEGLSIQLGCVGATGKPCGSALSQRICGVSAWQQCLKW